MYRLQSFANSLVFNSLAKKKFIFYIVIYNILYNFARAWIHLLGRKVLKCIYTRTNIRIYSILYIAGIPNNEYFSFSLGDKLFV